VSLKIVVPGGYTLIAEKARLRAVLRAAGAEVAARARGMIRAGGATRKRAAKRTSVAGGPPVSRTGTLARSMQVRIFRNGDGVRVTDTAQSARGSRAPYALFLEKGAQGGKSSGRKGGKGNANAWKRIGRQKQRVSVVGRRVLAPHPFMEPALDQTVNNGLADRVRDAIVSGLKFRRGP
jgi:hypothetical protein